MEKLEQYRNYVKQVITLQLIRLFSNSAWHDNVVQIHDELICRRFLGEE